MRSLRPMAEYTLLGKKEVATQESSWALLTLTTKLTQYKIKWREHIKRMDDDRLPKKFTYKPVG